LSQVFNLTCRILRQGTRSDHHGHDWQDQADVSPPREVGPRDFADHEFVAQHHPEVAGRAAERRAEVPATVSSEQADPFEETLKQALKADARRPKKERRTALALYGELKAEGYRAATHVTDFIRAWRQGKAKVRRSRPSCR
jgi:hypothetical protein